MNKNVIIFGIIALVVLVAGFFAYKQFTNDPTTQEGAIEQAESFESGGGGEKEVCADVMTPAFHKTTGAEHTFTSSCLPDGWETEN